MLLVAAHACERVFLSQTGVNVWNRGVNVTSVSATKLYTLQEITRSLREWDPMGVYEILCRDAVK
jgi:hypothetical protein